MEMGGIAWSLAALRDTCEALTPLSADDEHSRAAFTLAGQGTFWAAALDEQCRLYEPDGYPSRRDDSSHGQTVNGLRWVRDRYAHQVAVAIAQDRTPFLPGPPFYIVPAGFVWAPRAAVVAGDPEHDNDRHGRQTHYDERLALRQIVLTLRQAVGWFESEQQQRGSLMHAAVPVAPAVVHVNRRVG
jgi:hypothetical protein